MRSLFEPDPYTPVYIREYDDWADMVNHAAIINEQHVGNQYQGLSCASLETGKFDWYRTHSLGEAIDLARYGWATGRTDLQQLFDRLNIEEMVPKIEQLMPVFSFAGDEVDVGRMLAGIPEHMVTWPPEELFSEGRILRILVNKTVSHTVNADQIMHRGAAVLAAMQVLELIGYSVEITLGFSVTSMRYGMTRFEVFVPIKQAGQVLNLDTAAFMLLHPSVLRRLLFACQELEATEIREEFGFFSSGTYGSSINVLRTDGYHLVVNNYEGLNHYDRDVVPFALTLLERVGVNRDNLYIPMTGT